MSAPHSHAIKNNLLRQLAPQELAAVSIDLLPVDLPKDFMMAAANGPIEHVYFPDSGLGSIVVVSPEGNKVEGGMFGHDGFSPVQPAVGSDISPHEAVMQAGGHGHRIALAPFRTALKESPQFARILAC